MIGGRSATEKRKDDIIGGSMRGNSDKRNDAVASDRLYRAVRSVIQEAHGVVSRVANWAMVEANWRVGFRDALRHELS